MGTRIFIGGFSYRVRERDLERFCEKYGKIREISMKTKYAFVEFEDYRDADDAVYELNGKSLLGERVTVEIAKGIDRSLERNRSRGYNSYSRPPPPRRGWGSSHNDRDDRFGPPTRSDHRLIVENLSSRVSWQDLKDFMRQVGEVCYADAHKRHKNEGVVEFESYTDMKKALEKLDNSELNGRRIRLIEDKPRGSRRSRSSSSRSRSRSRSRSSKSRSRTRSKSGSPRKSKSKGKSVSRSPSKSRKRSRSRSRSESRGRKISKGSASPEKKRSRTRSRSRSRSASGSPERNGNDKSPQKSDVE